MRVYMHMAPEVPIRLCLDFKQWYVSGSGTPRTKQNGCDLDHLITRSRWQKPAAEVWPQRYIASWTLLRALHHPLSGRASTGQQAVPCVNKPDPGTACCESAMLLCGPLGLYNYPATLTTPMQCKNTGAARLTRSASSSNNNLSSFDTARFGGLVVTAF